MDTATGSAYSWAPSSSSGDFIFNPLHDDFVNLEDQVKTFELVVTSTSEGTGRENRDIQYEFTFGSQCFNTALISNVDGHAIPVEAQEMPLGHLISHEAATFSENCVNEGQGYTFEFVISYDTSLSTDWI